jgi:WD40 repeat protein
VWVLETGACERIFSGHNMGVTSVAVTADGGVILSGGKDGTLRVWDPASGAELARVANDAVVAAIAVATDASGRTWVAIGGPSGVTLFQLIVAAP